MFYSYYYFYDNGIKNFPKKLLNSIMKMVINPVKIYFMTFMMFKTVVYIGYLN